MNTTPAVTNSDVPSSSPNCVKIDIEGFYNMSALDQEAALEAALKAALEKLKVYSFRYPDGFIKSFSEDILECDDYKSGSDDN